MINPIAFGRACKAVRRAAKARGLNGDFYADVPALGTLEQELTAAALEIDIPKAIRDEAGTEIVRRLVRSIVFSSEAKGARR